MFYKQDWVNVIKIEFMKRIIFSMGVLMSFLMVGMMSSCRKESPTVAVITVVDTSGAIFEGATVRLYPVPTLTMHPGITIDDLLDSDINGQATFDYTDQFNLGQAGFAILDIEIWSGDTLSGTGIIKVEAEETSEETVVLLP
jgi:hypothetical protein